VQIYRGHLGTIGFSQAKLLTRLQAVNSSITAIDAEYVHFADTIRLWRTEQYQRCGTGILRHHYLLAPRTGFCMFGGCLRLANYLTNGPAKRPISF